MLVSLMASGAACMGGYLPGYPAIWQPCRPPPGCFSQPSDLFAQGGVDGMLEGLHLLLLIDVIHRPFQSYVQEGMDFQS